MNARKLRKIQDAIDAARRKAVTHSDLESIALSLGRVRLKGAQVRGKEPAYVSTVFSDARPISIPDHGASTIKPNTKKNILNDLEADIFRHRARLEEEAEDVQESNEYEN